MEESLIMAAIAMGGIVFLLAVTGIGLYIGLRAMRPRDPTPDDLEYERRQRRKPKESFIDPLLRDPLIPTPEGEMFKLLRRINEKLDQEGP